MPKQPVVTGREFVRVLERLGYEFVRQRGSHTIMANRRNHKKTSVPCHGNRPLPTGMLAALLDETGLSTDELRDLLD